MLDGEIKALVADKGFGFIQPAAGDGDVFFHRSVVDAPWAKLVVGQRVQFELDPQAEKTRAITVKVSDARPSPRAASRGGRPSPAGWKAAPRRRDEREAWEHGFVTKLYRKQFRGFISSVKHGPEFLFAAESVLGPKRFSRLEIGDYVQFLVGETDPADAKQPVAKAVKVVERKIALPPEMRTPRHAKARGKKPTWR